MKSLYDLDAFAWAREQASAIRSLGRRAEAHGLDWERVASGIDAVGQDMLDAAEGAIRTGLKHAILGYCDTDSPLVWLRRSETLQARSRLRRALSPSLRPRLDRDRDRLWSEAFDAAMRELTPRVLGVPPSLPLDCPFTLDDLADIDFTYDRAVERLYALLTSPRPTRAGDRSP